MDALCEVLGVIRLTGADFLEMELRAQWSCLTAPAREADHVIAFHLLAEGICYARLVDGEFVELTEGELVMFPGGDPRVLATASDASLQLEPTENTGESLSYLKRTRSCPSSPAAKAARRASCAGTWPAIGGSPSRSC